MMQFFGLLCWGLAGVAWVVGRPLMALNELLLRWGEALMDRRQ